VNKHLQYLLLTLLIGLFGAQAAAVTISVEPSYTETRQLGIPISLDITVSGLTAGGPDSLGAFSMDLAFGSSILGYDSVDFGAFLGSTDPLLFEADFFVDESGLAGSPSTLYIEEISFLTNLELDALQGSSFTLATLHFTTVSRGLTLVRPQNVVLSDAYGFQLAAPSIDVGRVYVDEPQSLWLLLIGSIALSLARRQRA